MKDISPWNQDTMGSLMMHFYLMAALHVSLCGAAPTSNSLMVRSPVSVRPGHTATLPCWVNPPQSAEGLEVRWYRGQFDSPIILYRARKFENTSLDTSYAGRVSFGLKDATSGGLKAGDVSLKLASATIKDSGKYNCYVSSEQAYDNAVVELSVIEMGASPLLSVVWTEDNMMNVSCESKGWNPKPSLRWSDHKQDLTADSLKYSEESSGLVSVRSWLLVSSISEVSCSVGLSGEEAKEARVRLDNPPQLGSGSSVAGWVFFALLLLALLAVLGVLYYKKRVKKTKLGSDKAEENQKLLTKDVTPLTTANDHYVNVALDETGNSHLTIKGHKLRDAISQDVPDGINMACLTAIKGTPGFSSGQHYWEVSMGNTEIGLKKSWWVGVTSADVNLQNPDLSPTASKGLWLLSSSPDREDTFQFSTEPIVLLPVNSRPQTLGVYLDYDGGQLSFFNVEDQSLIGTLTAKFEGHIFPFFNPGTGDKAPMEILQRAKQGQSGDMGNSVDSTAQETQS